jgi:hypothetical protein
VPRPTPRSPTPARYRAPPNTARSTPGSLIEASTPFEAKMLWPIQKAPKEATRPVPMTTAVKVVALAARTVRRWGVAAKVARI